MSVYIGKEAMILNDDGRIEVRTDPGGITFAVTASGRKVEVSVDHVDAAEFGLAIAEIVNEMTHRGK